MESASGGGLGEAVSLGGSGELSGEVLHGGASLLLLDDGDDLRLHLGDGLKVSGLLIFDLQDVVAELGLDDAGGLAGREREGGLVELRNSLAGIEPAELSALSLAAGVVGVLGGEVGEVCRRT